MRYTYKGFQKFLGASGSLFTSLSPSLKAAQWTLSNGNLTGTLGATTPSNYHNLGSVLGKTTGKLYCEFTINNLVGGTLPDFGFAKSNWSLWSSTTSATFPGIDNNSVGLLCGFGIHLNGSAVVSYADGAATGQVVSLALDIDNLRFWARKNGGTWNNSGTANPATNTEGVDISVMTGSTFHAVVSFQRQNDQVTANFGGSAFAFAAPAGFAGW